MKIPFLLCVLTMSLSVNAQTLPDAVTIFNNGEDCSIRGMSIPANDIVWASGSKGHVARTTDGGKTWKWMVVRGYEKVDFRDIHAFDSSTAIIMGIDNPAYILKTKDGGQSWKLVYTKDTSGMFLDAMDFRNEKEGICIGDPLDAGGGKRTFFIIRTTDGGETWERESQTWRGRSQPYDKVPPALPGEAVFSASGTNIALLRSRKWDYAFISGGLRSNLYLISRKGSPAKVVPLPVNKGTESSGAFSMATDGRKRFYCIGGDYKAPDVTKDCFVWTTDDGLSWNAPTLSAPYGYRSCIRIIAGRRLIACGSNGVDMCTEPETWTRISAEGFNVCMVSPDKKTIFFGGGKGKIGVLRL